MGRVKAANQSSSTPSAPPSSSPLIHFSHPHKLCRLVPHHTIPQTPFCTACGLQSSGVMYTCTLPCAFALHQSCFDLPRRTTHPSHGGCTLTLLTDAAYDDATFICDACDRPGGAWSYHCALCEYDLHVTCVAKPMKIRHVAHSSCELKLTFRSPYSKSNAFMCDVCAKKGQNQWCYRCDTCDFDVHLDCTAVGHIHTYITTHHGDVLQRNNSFQVVQVRGGYVMHNLVHNASTDGIKVHANYNYALLPF